MTRRLTAKAVDVAVFGETGYVEAKKADGSIRYLATCVMPEDHNFSFVFIRKDSPVQTVADVRGRSLGLTDTQSTSGCMFPRHMLRQAGIMLDSYPGERTRFRVQLFRVAPLDGEG